MKPLMGGAILILVATTSSSFAAAPAPAASSAAPDGYATQAKSMGKKKVDAMAQKNERMSKCKAMKEDEKKGCEADAEALANKELESDAPRSARTTKK